MVTMHNTCIRITIHKACKVHQQTGSATTRCDKKVIPWNYLLLFSNHLEFQCELYIFMQCSYLYLTAKQHLTIFKYNEVIDTLMWPPSNFCAPKNVCVETPQNSVTETINATLQKFKQFVWCLAVTLSARNVHRQLCASEVTTVWRYRNSIIIIIIIIIIIAHLFSHSVKLVTALLIGSAQQAVPDNLQQYTSLSSVTDLGYGWSLW